MHLIVVEGRARKLTRRKSYICEWQEMKMLFVGDTYFYVPLETIDVD